MDSRPRGLPFSVSRSRTSYTSPSTYTSSPLSSTRLYSSRDRVLTSDRLPSRASTPFKADLCQQRFRNLIEESPSWLEPLPTLNSSRDWLWAESPASSRTKQTDSERRTGLYSGLLKANDDGDFKRAKLSYSSRDTRTSSSSVTAPTYSSIGTGEKPSSWRSYSSTLSPSSTSYSSPSSKPLSTRRDLLNRHLREPEETRYGSHLSSLGESRRRSPGLTSLYEPDRLTSSYAQGARPKEPIYSSSTSTARESYRPRYFPSLEHSARTTAHTPSSYTSSTPSSYTTTTSSSSLRSSSSTSSSLRSSQEQTRKPVSPTVARSARSPSSSSRSSWCTPSLAAKRDPSPSKPQTTAALSSSSSQRPAPVGGEPEGRRSLLSRIFSRRSSQDSSGGSSSGSSSTRSLDSLDGGPTTTAAGVEEAAARTPNVATTPEPDASYRHLASYRLRRRFFDAPNTPADVATPESDTPQHLTSHRLRRRFFDTPRSDGDGGGGHATWFSSYLRNRSAAPPPPPPPPPQSEGTSDGIKEATAGRQHTRRRWEDPEHKAPSEDEDDEEEEEDEEEKEDEEAGGASGVTVSGLAGSNRVYMQSMRTTFRDHGYVSSATPTVTVHDNAFAAVDRSQAEAREKDKPVASRDPERLRKIQERLLLEESDEDEGDLCRICQMGEDSASNPLIVPCRCTGSLQYVHQECIKTWLHSKISSGAGLEALTTCELCKEKLHLNIENFNIHELHRVHEQSEYEFIRSGLYLVVLLHLYEQRFSDEAGVRTHTAHSTLSPLLASLDEYLDIHVERLPGESEDDDEEVVVDNRPSIDFSDLDDDLEEY